MSPLLSVVRVPSCRPCSRKTQPLAGAGAAGSGQANVNVLAAIDAENEAADAAEAAAAAAALAPAALALTVHQGHSAVADGADEDVADEDDVDVEFFEEGINKYNTVRQISIPIDSQPDRLTSNPHPCLCAESSVAAPCWRAPLQERRA